LSPPSMLLKKSAMGERGPGLEGFLRSLHLAAGKLRQP
jgi:hypothetical protein